MRCEVSAIVIADSELSAAHLGNLAIEDLLTAVLSLKVEGFVVNVVRSHKYCETKGKAACLVDLEFDVKYKFSE